jgi:hypothetical protein
MPARAAAQRIPGDLRVHVGVAVDESRRHDQAVGVERAPCRTGDSADFDDAAVLDANVGAKARFAGAVDQRAATNEKVEGHYSRSLCSTIFQ